MPANPRRSQAQRVRDEKGQYTDHMTSTEMCRFLGVAPRTFRKWQQDGLEPAQRSPRGWGLWSPDQQQQLLRREARL